LEAPEAPVASGSNVLIEDQEQCYTKQQQIVDDQT
jgi:hypothetical protein